jgi:hypothetical protein
VKRRWHNLLVKFGLREPVEWWDGPPIGTKVHEAMENYLIAEAKQVIEYGLHLRMYGEKAPGGNETWEQWDNMAEAWLRGMNK